MTLGSELSVVTPWYFDTGASPGWHDYVGILLTVFGFVFALQQLRKTRDATTTATNALSKAQLRLSQSQLSLVSSAIHNASVEIDFAIESENRSLARFALVRYGQLAQEASNLLGQDPSNEGLIDSIGASLGNALSAKQKIVTTDGDLTRIVKGVSAEITRISSDVHAVVTQTRDRMEEGNANDR